MACHRASDCGSQDNGKPLRKKECSLIALGEDGRPLSPSGAAKDEIVVDLYFFQNLKNVLGEIYGLNGFVWEASLIDPHAQ